MAGSEERIIRLKILCDMLSETEGCHRCAEVYGEDRKDWCCKETNPEITIGEFDRLLQHMQTWTEKERSRIYIKAIADYLALIEGSPIGCPFYHDGCTVYHVRPFGCRFFGQRPKELVEEQRKEAAAEGKELQKCDILKIKKPLTLTQAKYLLRRLNEICDVAKYGIEDIYTLILQQMFRQTESIVRELEGLRQEAVEVDDEDRLEMAKTFFEKYKDNVP